MAFAIQPYFLTEVEALQTAVLRLETSEAEAKQFESVRREGKSLLDQKQGKNIPIYQADVETRLLCGKDNSEYSRTYTIAISNRWSPPTKAKLKKTALACLKALTECSQFFLETFWASFSLTARKIEEFALLDIGQLSRT